MYFQTKNLYRCPKYLLWDHTMSTNIIKYVWYNEGRICTRDPQGALT